MITEIDKKDEFGNRTLLVNKLNNSEYIVEAGKTLSIVYFGPKSNSKVRIVLNGKNARADFFGFIVGRSDDKYNFNIVAEHSKAETKSTIRIKSVLYDNSLFNFSGNLIINKQAHESDTYLSSHSLLMNKGAKAHAIPSLEILANDVKAGHAATVGKVNDEDLFYLESRGIKKTQAEQLLVLGFFEGLLGKIEDIDLRDSLRQAIIKSLPF